MEVQSVVELSFPVSKLISISDFYLFWSGLCAGLLWGAEKFLAAFRLKQIEETK